MNPAQVRLAENIIRRLYTHVPSNVKIHVNGHYPELEKTYSPVLYSMEEVFLPEDAEKPPDLLIQYENTKIFGFIVPELSTLDDEWVKRVRSAASEEATRIVVTYPKLTKHCEAAVKRATQPITDTPDWFRSLARSHGGKVWRPLDEQSVPVVTHRDVRSLLKRRLSGSDFSRQRFVLFKKSHYYGR